ncbi:MAG: hypothetical protein ABWZ25_08025 [Chitinophagaceae bacterium]
MNINRDNYEEFFILYGDNELSSEDRIRVEEFVRENNDLEPEFAILNQLKFTPDEELSFTNKESLLRVSGNSFSRNQELLLLSVDNELSATDQAELAELLKRDSDMQAELALYKKTKADPNDRIVFPDKTLLYRNNEPARVVPFGWRRFAAAAAVLIAVSVTAFIVFNDKDNAGLAVTTTPQVKTTEPLTGTAKTGLPVVKQPVGINSGAEVIDSPVTNPTYNPAQEVLVVGHKNADKKTISPVKQNQRPQNIIKEEVARKNNELPSPVQNPGVNIPVNEKENIAAADKLNKVPTVTPKQINPVTTVTLKPDDPLQLVVIKQPDPADETEDQGHSSKKSKLRGFFRKVTRTFEKTTNIKATDDEDRLLLGGLAIRL